MLRHHMGDGMKKIRRIEIEDDLGDELDDLRAELEELREELEALKKEGM
jgi:hypothetical protein